MIELHANCFLTITGSIVNIIGGNLCCVLMAHCQWTWRIDNNSMLAPRFMGLIMASSDIFAATQKFQPREFEW